MVWGFESKGSKGDSLVPGVGASGLLNLSPGQMFRSQIHGRARIHWVWGSAASGLWIGLVSGFQRRGQVGSRLLEIKLVGKLVYPVDASYYSG